eukprot:GFKZ01009314.1.p1 GENE.GFKZ01009314.1~~GFKZ01009314.1.p1  ORF type:complete len:290 (+),score=32.51 GFKZ01009314.1:437-1306(+)
MNYFNPKAEAAGATAPPPPSAPPYAGPKYTASPHAAPPYTAPSYNAAPNATPPPPPPPATANVNVKTATTPIRLAFIRKVYTLLTINFLITVGVSCAFAFIIPIREYVVDNTWVIFAAIAATVVSFIAVSCIKTKFPVNLILMYLFILSFSALIASIVAFYFAGDAGGIVLQAFCATAATFIAITAYVFITKKDFSFLYGFLSAMVLVLIGLAIANFVLRLGTGRRSRLFSFAISALGALIMIGYLLYDTSLVITRLGPDDWLQAVIMLYIDVTTLFLYFLNIFSFANS